MKISQEDHDYYWSQSAVDLTAYMLPQPQMGIDECVKLGTLSMLSVSTHRDKFPVSACSRLAPRGFTAGHRTIAGTLSFQTLDREVISRLRRPGGNVYDDVHGSSLITDFTQADELPLFNISIVIVNDFGHASYSVIEGVTLLDSGVTYSIANVALMENYSYMATNRVPLQPISEQDDWAANVNELLRLSTTQAEDPQIKMYPTILSPTRVKWDPVIVGPPRTKGR